MVIRIIHRQPLGSCSVIQVIVGREKQEFTFTCIHQTLIDDHRCSQMNRIVATQGVMLNQSAGALNDGFIQRCKAIERVTVLSKQIVYPGMLVRGHRPFSQSSRKSTPHLDTQQV